MGVDRARPEGRVHGAGGAPAAAAVPGLEGSFAADYRVFRCRDYVAEADLQPDRRYELRWRAGPEFYGRGACHLVITEVGAQPAEVAVDHVFTEEPACGLASAVETRY